MVQVCSRAEKSRRPDLSSEREQRSFSAPAWPVLLWESVRPWEPARVLQMSDEQVLERRKYQLRTISSHYSPVDILFILNVIVGQNASSGLFDCRTFQDRWPNPPNESDNVVTRLFSKCPRNIVESANFFRVDLVNDLESQIGQIRVSPIRQYIAKDDDS